MKVDSFNKTQSLELQKKFLKNLLKSKPNKFKELALMLKDYSKKSVSLNTVYDKLSSKHIYFFLFRLSKIPTTKRI